MSMADLKAIRPYMGDILRVPFGSLSAAQIQTVLHYVNAFAFLDSFA